METTNTQTVIDKQALAAIKAVKEMAVKTNSTIKKW